MNMSTLQQTSKERFNDLIPTLCEQHGIKNRMAAPRVTKVCLNMGVGRAVQDGQILNIVADHLTLLAGQKATIAVAKKSVAQFRSREGMKIGARVTLRGERMWSFIDRLINIAIPRIRDFRGISPKGFDEQGNFNMGLTEQALFPEVSLDRLEHNQGLNITVVFENSDKTKSFEILKGIGMPFRER
jgi:large subunit ribosomal protein L5